MRSFSKKLAFVLAAAMVVTAFAPAAKAEAAKEMAINKSSQILYVNEGINHKGGEVAAPGKGNVSVYDFSVKNKPADWKTALKFEWTTDDTDVVSVAKGGVVTAVGVGKATVYCKVTDKATKEVTTLKTKVTVKANAYEVEISNADKWDGATVEVDGVVDLNRTMYDEDGNKTTKRGTLVTDYTKWVAEPAAGVEIDQKTGKFTFTEAAVAGEYKLSCYTYQSSKYTEKTAESDVVVVEFVKADKFELAQTASNGFNLVFGKAADVKIADVSVNKIITVGNGTSKVVTPVKDVIMSEDKKTASVSVFSNFENGATYEVSVKGYDEAVTFVASYGTPVSMTISSESQMQNGLLISTYKEEKLTYKLFDAQGNDVTNTINPTYVSWYATNNSTDYYVNGNIIFITKAGVDVSVTAEFHYYDSLANEQVIKATGVFVGVDKAPEEIVSLSLVPNRYGTTYPNNQISMTFDKDIELEFKLKTSKQGDWDQQYVVGQQITNLGNFGGVNPPVVRMRSTNPDVLDILPGAIARDGLMVDTMVFFKEGTSTVLVELVNQNADNTDRVVTVAAVTITVTAKGAVSKIDVYGTAVAGTVNVADYDIGKVGIAAKDQYGNLHDVNHDTAFVEVKFADGKAISAGSITHEQRGAGNGWTDQVVVDGSALLADMVTAGYLTIVDGEWYVGNMKVNSITKTVAIKANVWCAPDYPNVDFKVNVTLKKPIAGVSRYDIEASGTTSGNVARYDNANDGNNSTEVDKKLTFKMFVKSNDVKVQQIPMNIKPAYGAIASGAAVDSMWFTLTHDGVDVTDLTYALTVDGEGTVTLAYSSEEDLPGGLSGKQVAYRTWSGATNSYKNLGAGTYTITVYRITENAAGELGYAYVGTSSVSVNTDFGGSYGFVKRLAESVGLVDQATLRNCFEFTGRNGQKTENPNYYVDYVLANDYVHVKSVTFYEELTGYAGVYAPYTVNVNVSLKLQQMR